MCEIRGVGSNSHHQLGQPSVDDLHSFTLLPQHSSPSYILGIATGANHSLLLVENEKAEVKLLGAGSNQRGQLDPSSSSFSSLRTSFLPLPRTTPPRYPPSHGLLSCCCRSVLGDFLSRSPPSPSLFFLFLLRRPPLFQRQWLGRTRRRARRNGRRD
jgi:hypothetical protein